MRQMYQNLRRLLAAVSLLFVVGFVHAQITVTGTVMDGKFGGPLPGATVKVKGTTTGTQTDFDGNFSIKVQDGNAELEISFMGYETKTLKVGDKTKFDFTLKEKSSEIKEVAVVGYGVQKKTDVTGAVSTIGGDDVNSRPVLGVDQAMQGKVGGVQIRNNSGSPGGSTMVSVRGVGTVNNAEPLYVVDGVPTGSIKTLNPGDIKSISVLKDASACAIYGSRGANGVIIITTKEGKMGSGGKGDNNSLSVDVSYGIQSPWRLVDVANASEHRQILSNAGIVRPFKPYLSGYDITGAGTNWQKEIFRTPTDASFNRAQISLDGGSETISYSISSSYNKQNGIVKGTDYDRLTFRSKISAHPYKKLNVGAGMYYNTTNRTQLSEGGLYSGNVLWHALLMDPEMPVKIDSAGTKIWSNPYTNDAIQNPVAIIALNNQTTKGKDYGFNVYGEYEFIKNLKFKSLFSYANWYSNYENFTPTYYVRYNFKETVARYNRNTTDGANQTWSNTLSYSKDIMDKQDTTKVAHSISLLAGQEIFMQKQLQEAFTIYGNQYNSEDMRYLSNFKDSIAVDKNVKPTEEGLYSFLGRINYSYKDRYLTTVNLRRDGSSRFLENNKWGNFPSFSLGWKISQEDFFATNEKLRFINDLKLRLGWGRIGNQRVDSYRIFSTMTSYRKGYAFGSTQTAVPGTTVNQMSNPDLRWETTEQVNAGIDISFLKNKFTFQFDYFDKTTRDMLINIPLPTYAGGEYDPDVASGSSILANVGSINNKGIEAMLSFRNQFKKVNYEIGANITAVRNTVLDLGKSSFSTKDYIESQADGDFKLPLCRTAEGRSIAEFYGYVTDGVYDSYSELASGPKPAEGTKLGDFKYVDINGDGKIDENDRTYIGSPLPKFTYGTYVSVDCYGFDLSVSLMGSYGNKIFNLTKYYLNGAGDDVTNYSKDRLNAWSASNHTSEPKSGGGVNYRRPSSAYVEDGSYIRLKDIVLGYTFPITVTNKLKVSKIRVYGQIQNLLTFTKYTGFDPEIGKLENQGDSNLEIGVDRATYPQARTFVGGVMFVF